MTGIMLEIDTEQKALTGEPDGYINVMWHKIDALEMPTTHMWTRLVIGWIALIGIVVLFGGLAWREAVRQNATATRQRPTEIAAE
jgi:Trk-type K+ transport system membrane component